MILQTSVQNPNVSLSSSLSNSHSLQPKTLNNFIPKKHERKVKVTVRCSISKVHSYGTVDFERRRPLKWNALYKRISLIENPEMGIENLLNKWERDNKKLTKWELCRIVKELRKFKRYDRALQVYEWINSRGEQYFLSSSDAAIQLDLIAKVRGVVSAENFFSSLSNKARDKKIYGAMLNAYVRSKRKKKAEALLDQMKTKGYASYCLPFNVMMTLYMSLEDYERVDAIISEMMKENIKLDLYSYNIWLSCLGSQGYANKMEQVYERMRLDDTVNPNWTIFSTMATMYIKMRMFEKAEECLRKVESRITGRDRIPYHYLISLYASVGNKNEIYRVWNSYKSTFPSIPNLGYHTIICSLLRIGDLEGAERLYEEWLPVKSSYDPRIANLFMCYFVRNGDLERAMRFVDHVVEVGGKPNSGTWEALAEGHTIERKIPEALSYWREAFAAEGVKNWRPKAANVAAFFNLCDQESDIESKQVLVGMLKTKGYLEDEIYDSQIGIQSTEGSFEIDVDENRNDDSDVFLNRL